MMKFDELLKDLVYIDKFNGKVRIKNCDNFQYEIDREAIAYHISYCTDNYPKVPKNVWEEIYHNNNDNKKNWPSIFRKKQKTARDKEIISKYIGRWRWKDNFLSPFIGAVLRVTPSFIGLWRWNYYARLFFSFENRDNMKEYLDEYPDLLPEPGFVVYYNGDPYDTFDME